MCGLPNHHGIAPPVRLNVPVGPSGPGLFCMFSSTMCGYLLMPVAFLRSRKRVARVNTVLGSIPIPIAGKSDYSPTWIHTSDRIFPGKPLPFPCHPDRSEAQWRDLRFPGSRSSGRAPPSSPQLPRNQTPFHVREIAERAGVGLGTVYCHFPQRSDLIVAAFKSQMDACADAASVIASKYEPGEALARWMQRYVDFIATKRGLAAALHSGDPAYRALPGYFDKRLRPALRTLLDAAVRAKVVRPAMEADNLLRAAATLCHGAHGEEPAYARKMVELLVDGLRYGAGMLIETPGKRRR
jgi:AcrR family transcriptional regulator